MYFDMTCIVQDGLGNFAPSNGIGNEDASAFLMKLSRVDQTYGAEQLSHQNGLGVSADRFSDVVFSGKSVDFDLGVDLQSLNDDCHSLSSKHYHQPCQLSSLNGSSQSCTEHPLISCFNDNQDYSDCWHQFSYSQNTDDNLVVSGLCNEYSTIGAESYSSLNRHMNMGTDLDLSTEEVFFIFKQLGDDNCKGDCTFNSPDELLESISVAAENSTLSNIQHTASTIGSWDSSETDTGYKSTRSIRGHGILPSQSPWQTMPEIRRSAFTNSISHDPSPTPNMQPTSRSIVIETVNSWDAFQTSVE